MSRIVAIGAPLELLGWRLVGVELVPALDADEARAAWNGLDPEVGLVLLTPAARGALPPALDIGPLWAVVPS